MLPASLAIQNVWRTECYPCSLPSQSLRWLRLFWRLRKILMKINSSDFREYYLSITYQSASKIVHRDIEPPWCFYRNALILSLQYQIWFDCHRLSTQHFQTHSFWWNRVSCANSCYICLSGRLFLLFQLPTRFWFGNEEMFRTGNNKISNIYQNCLFQLCILNFVLVFVYTLRTTK